MIELNSVKDERSTYPKFLSNSSVFLLTMVSEFPIEVILLLAMFHLESRLLISILIIATKKKRVIKGLSLNYERKRRSEFFAYPPRPPRGKFKGTRWIGFGNRVQQKLERVSPGMARN